MEKSISQLAIRFNLPAFFLSIVLVAAAVSGLKQLQFDGSTRAFFGPDHPQLLAYEALEAEFGRVDSVMLMVSAKEGHMFTVERLALLEELTAAAWLIPYALRVESLTNYQDSQGVDDELLVDAFIENAVEYDAEKLQWLRQRALKDQSILNRLITPDGKHSALTLYMSLSGDNNRQTEETEVNSAVYHLIHRLEDEHPDIDIAVTGNVISSASLMESTLKDLNTIFPAMYALIFILLAILLRSIFAMLTIAVTAIASSMSALGIASYMGIVFSPVSINAVTIVLTVAVAHCVHVGIYFLQLYRQNGNKKESLLESLRINLQPMFITSFTTAIGFLSLNLNELGPAADLGNAVAAGVMVAFVLSITLLPALLLMLPVSAKKTAAGSIDERMDKFSTWVIQHRNLLLWSTLAFSIVMSVLASQNIVNDRFTENIKKPHVFRTDAELFDKHLGGLYTIEYSIGAKDINGISDVEYLQKLKQFTDWLRQQPEIISVFSYSDVIQRLNKNMHNEEAAWEKIPASKELAAQYLLLYEMSVSADQDLSNQINIDRSATRLVIKFPTVDSSKIMALHLKIIAWQKHNLPEYMRNEGSSYAVMWTYLAGDVTTNSTMGAVVALILIPIILMVVFRSIRYGLISLVPNLLPATVGYGFWFLYIGEMSMALMSVLSITIGIVVDDTVHFLSKYLRARREQQADSQDAVRFAFRSVGPALWITSVVLIAGFSTQAFSQFQPSGHMGMLIAVIIAAALLLDFLMLPPLLMWFDRKDRV